MGQEGQPVTMAGHEVVDGVSNSSWNEVRHRSDSVSAAEIVRGQECRVGPNGDEFVGLAVLRAKPNHRVDRLELGMPCPEVVAVLSVQGGEAERALPIMPQDGLDGCAAEATSVIKKQDWITGSLGRC